MMSKCVLMCHWRAHRCVQSCVKGARVCAWYACVACTYVRGVCSLHGAHMAHVMCTVRAPVDLGLWRTREMDGLSPRSGNHRQQAWPGRECGVLCLHNFLPLPWIGWAGPPSLRSLTLPEPAAWTPVPRADRSPRCSQVLQRLCTGEHVQSVWGTIQSFKE